MPVDKSLPFPAEVFHELAEHYGTPLYVYDEGGIRQSAQDLTDAFGWSPGYVNHFAVKATPIPAVLRALQDEGMGFDCSSRFELLMVRDQVRSENPVFYTSNNTPDEDYRLAASIGATINTDKLPYVAQVQRALGKLPTAMAARYNPGKRLAVRNPKNPIGEPFYAKFGDTEAHVLEELRLMRDGGVERIGLHTMVDTNQTDPEAFAEISRLLRELADKAYSGLGIEISFINVGGGIGVSYRPTDEQVDVDAIGEAVQSELGGLGIPVVSENGRYITGPHGYFLTRVTQGIVESYHRFLQVDTSVNNMARLATVNAAYHELHILGRDNDEPIEMTVVGSMCANTDKFFQNRMLPGSTQPGDLMVIHDAGAHMQSNSHNYNGQPRAGGVIVRPDGSSQWAIRRETVEEMLKRTAGL